MKKKNNLNPKISLIEKKGSNLTLSKFNNELIVFKDPLIWRKIICRKIIKKINIGKRKWKEKNRLKVG